MTTIPDLGGATLNVSRETTDRLRLLVDLLRKWNPAINLVSRNTVETAWDRHIIDSAQLFSVLPQSQGLWADLGSGGGFPGLVIATIAAEKAPDLRMVLVESDQRKASFLLQARHQLGLTTTVVAKRIEDIDPLQAQVITARALAPLDKLCGYLVRHLAPGGTAILPKGANVQSELDFARQYWRFEVEARPSVTDSQAVVLLLKDVVHV